MTTRDLDWLAGIVEGEAWIGQYLLPSTRISPTVVVGMSDKDVVSRVAKLFGTKLLGPFKPHSNGIKLVYRAKVNGATAAGWMMTLYSLLGNRRKRQIKEVLSKWKKEPVKQRNISRILATNGSWFY